MAVLPCSLNLAVDFFSHTMRIHKTPVSSSSALAPVSTRRYFRSYFFLASGAKIVLEEGEMHCWWLLLLLGDR